MFETLSRGFRMAQLKLQGKGVISEDSITSALRDVRVSLLEADVELSVVKTFLEQVRERALGEVIQLKAGRRADGMRVTPADHFVKICHDELVNLMGEEEGDLDLSGDPALVMMVGLQGSGKTTTAGKLARHYMRKGRRPMLVAADTYRPAAVDQLTTIGRKLGVPVFFIKGFDPVQLCEMALTQARNVNRDLVIFDTAGRLAIDNALMDEVVSIKERTQPRNVLFVCDAMIGQDAVRTAAEFDRRLDFTGFILTKLDGDARGGAALSIRQVTGKPVQFLGMGEGLDKLEPFRAEGLAGRILGMGDIVGLMHDFEDVVDQEDAERDAMEMLSGEFTFDTFINQIRNIRRMGSIKDLVGKMPMLSNMMDQIPEEALDDRELVRTEAIIQSMTRQERSEPDILDDSRIRRIARGSGREDQDVQELLERFFMTRKTMKQLGQMSGLFGGGRKARRMRKMLADQGGDMESLAAGAGMMGMPPMEEEEDRGPRISPEEKIARRRKQKRARKARRRSRRRKK